MDKTTTVILTAAVMLLNITVIAAHLHLTAEEARKIALQYAGICGGRVNFTKTYLDWKDGRQVYVIGFEAGQTGYEATVDATSGGVLDFSRGEPSGIESCEQQDLLDSEQPVSTQVQALGVERLMHR